MQLNYILSKELAGKMILVHPPEPRKELLLSPPGDGIYLGKTRFLGTPVFWDFRKLINPHISIVVITGSGKSIDKDEPVVIRQNGQVKLAKIGELVDNLINSSPCVQTLDDVEGVPNPNIEVYSFDETLRNKWVQVNFAGRKKAPSKAYTFKTASGRMIKTTGDHNLVVIRDGRITVAKSSEAETGDYVPLARSVLFEGEEFIVNIFDLLKHHQIHIIGMHHVIHDNYKLLKSAFPLDRKYDRYLNNYKKGRAIPISYFLRLMICLKLDPSMYKSEIKLRLRNGITLLPYELKNEKASAMARLCGYVVSEGCIQKSFINVNTTETEFLNDIKKCLFTLGFPFFDIPNGIRVSSRAPVQLFKDLGIGSLSSDKHIPPSIFGSRLSYLSEFLKGYFEGDGGVEEKAVSATTKSKDLANQLCYAFLRFGILARVHPCWKRATNSAHAGGIYYRVTISGKDNISKYAKAIGFITKRKCDSLESLLGRCGKGHSNVDVLPNINNVVEALRQKFQLPRTQMTYSIRTGLRNPSRGYIRNFISQIPQAHLQSIQEDKELEFLTYLTESDLFWDPIVEKVEQISEADEKVYDLSVDTEVFLAGFSGMFIHNSYLVKSFLTRASLLWDSNAIILDWVGEYVKWVKQAGGTVINLGEEKLNLLDLAGLTKSERIKQIVSALDVLLDLKSYPHERDDIEEALEEVYDSGSAKKGVGHRASNPTLADVAERLMKNKKKSAARLVKRFTVGGSDFFSGKSSIDLKKITRSGLVCIDLHSLPTEEIRSLAGLTILQYIKEIMRREGIREEKGVKLFVVLDEAWKIANDERSDVITIVREGRKYNFALIVASQNPTDLHKTIFSNVGTMFIMRLVLKEFRDYVRQSVGYSDFIDNEISRFGVGDAALNMIFAQRQGKSSTFLLNKIDGEEPLFLLKIKGGEMEVEVEREQLMKMFYELGLTEQQMGIVKMEFERGDGLLDAEKIVALLEKFGYSKSSIIAFLRQLGIDEKNIIQIFSLVKMRTAGKGVVNITMDD